MDDAHLYDRHIEQARVFMRRDEPDTPPGFWLDESVTSFQEFKYGAHFGWKNYNNDVYLPLPVPIAVGRDELEA